MLVSETPSATPETPAPLPVPSELPSVPCGAVAAGDGLSFGLSSVGLMSYIGYNNGQAYCYDWRDVKAIAAAPVFTVGLTKEGRLLCSGSDALRQESAKLNGITAVCCSSEIVYALSGDGRVIAIGARTESAAASDAEAQLYSEMLNTGALNNIRLIAAGSDFSLRLKQAERFIPAAIRPSFLSFRAQPDINCRMRQQSCRADGGRAVSLRKQCGKCLSFGAFGCGRLQICLCGQ